MNLCHLLDVLQTDQGIYEQFVCREVVSEAALFTQKQIEFALWLQTDINWLPLLVGDNWTTKLIEPIHVTV